MQEKHDKIIVCRNCQKEFIFSVGEQNFYEEKGLAAPVRCKECKAKRKEQQENSQIQANNIIENQKNKQDDFEEMLAKFRANTVLFEEEIERRNRKRK